MVGSRNDMDPNMELVECTCETCFDLDPVKSGLFVFDGSGSEGISVQSPPDGEPLTN